MVHVFHGRTPLRDFSLRFCPLANILDNMMVDLLIRCVSMNIVNVAFGSRVQNANDSGLAPNISTIRTGIAPLSPVVT